MGKKLKKAPQPHNRKLGRIVTILAAVVIVLLLAFLLFSQLSEVSDSKGFWDNFQTAQQN